MGQMHTCRGRATSVVQRDGAMTQTERANKIISDLMNALDSIRREAKTIGGSAAFIDGVARQAMDSCDKQRERNKHGYLVVKE